MVQFYFLSVLLNIFIGVILISNDEQFLSDEELNDDSKLIESKGKIVKESLKNDSIFTNKTFCFICGILSVIISVIKLFVVYHNGDKGCDIPVVGDLLPAVIGIIGGATILFDHYSDKVEDFEIPDIVQNLFLNNKRYLGCVCIIVAVLHFILPGVALL